MQQRATVRPVVITWSASFLKPHISIQAFDLVILSHDDHFNVIIVIFLTDLCRVLITTTTVTIVYLHPKGKEAQEYELQTLYQPLRPKVTWKKSSAKKRV